MSHNTKTVATATQDTQKEAMVYDLFNLTEKQADDIIANVQQASKGLQKTGNQCDFLKEVLDKVESVDEKIYTAFVAGKMSEESQDPFSFLAGLDN